MIKYAVITLPPPKEPIVFFYEARNFAQTTLGRNVGYYYFKIKPHKLQSSFEKLEKFGERTVFLSEEDVLVWVGCSGYLHIWDAKKPQPEPGQPGDFFKEKNRFLNWFREVFPKT